MPAVELYAMHFEGETGDAAAVFYVSPDCVSVLHTAVVRGQLGNVRIASVERVAITPPEAAPASSPQDTP